MVSDKKSDTLNLAFDRLQIELRKEPLPTETIKVLAETIKILTEINPALRY